MKDYFYILCLDERDSPNIKELSKLSKEQIRKMKYHRHFGLCGALFNTVEYPSIIQKIRRLQLRYFNEHKSLHYTEMLNNSGSFAALGRDPTKRKAVLQSLNYILENSDFHVISTFIDKHAVALKFGVQYRNKLTGVKKIGVNLQKPTALNKFNLYNLALKLILKDYYDFLDRRGAKGIIIAEARGKREDAVLINEFYNFQKLGADVLSGVQIRTRILDFLVVYKSQNHIGSQVADLITYPLYDNLVPHHSCRSDHIINFDRCIKKKIYSIRLFP